MRVEDASVFFTTEAEAVEALQRCALSDKFDIPRTAFTVDVHRRLFDQLGSGRRNADTVALIRQLLRREHYRRGKSADPAFFVPTTNALSDESTIEQHGCRGMRSGSEIRMRAVPWRPEWLPVGDAFPDESVASGLHIARRRSYRAVAADPFFYSFLGRGFHQYQTAAQRQAVRGAAAMSPGSTLLVNLPTGSGKTVVALGPIFYETRNRGTSVIFVPTISLAQDIERRVRQHLNDLGRSAPGGVAYTSETSKSDKQYVREGIGDGSLPIVITTPESGIGSLHTALRQAAKSGSLRYFVIDEAHLVRTWGTDFRPEFQQLAALRRELISLAPEADALKTLLMSATFTGEDIDFLGGLFSDGEAVDMVAANALRPEPDYWVAKAPDEATRQKWILDAIAHLPRPIFLYTSWIDDAGRWVELIRANGYERVAQVTGTVPGFEHRGVMEKLRGDEGGTSIDIVVATSAFGLGVSFDDVRTVIHACMPESIDRLYQEVGRGGRDGYASTALCVWTEEDRHKATPLAQAVVIGREKAENRWRAMTQSRHSLFEPSGAIVVDLTAVPIHVPCPSETNVAWNRATLALMARAGFISIETMPNVSDGEDNDARWINRARIRTFRGDLANPVVWQAHWPALASKIRDEATSRLHQVECLVQENSRVCDILRDAYTVQKALAQFDKDELTPRRSCGQCLACGFQGERCHDLPEPNPIGQRILDSRRNRMPASGVVPVLVSAPTSESELQEICRRFLTVAFRAGASIIVLDRAFPLPKLVEEAHQTFSRPIFVADYHYDNPWMLPGLDMAVIGPLNDTAIRPNWLLAGGQPSSLVLISDGAPSFVRPDRTIREIKPANWVSLEELEVGS